MKVILHWIILSIAVFATAQIINGIIIFPIWAVLIVGACLFLVNMFIKPVLNILTLPLNIITLGIFSLILNGLIFLYLGSGIINGFSVSGFYPAFIGSIVISIINWIVIKIFRIK